MVWLGAGLLGFVAALAGGSPMWKTVWLAIGTVHCFMAATQFATRRRRARLAATSS